METKIIGKHRNARSLKLAHNRAKQKSRDFLFINTSSGIHKLKISEIEYLEANGNYTMVYTTCSNRILASRTLKYFEEILSAESFIRPHQSFLVNFNFIQFFQTKEKVELHLDSGARVTVSRSRKQTLYKLFKNQK